MLQIQSCTTFYRYGQGPVSADGDIAGLFLHFPVPCDTIAAKAENERETCEWNAGKYTCVGCGLFLRNRWIYGILNTTSTEDICNGKTGCN